jgi:hypothetical protein
VIRDTHDDTGLCGQIGVIRGVTPGPFPPFSCLFKFFPRHFSFFPRPFIPFPTFSRLFIFWASLFSGEEVFIDKFDQNSNNRINNNTFRRKSLKLCPKYFFQNVI